MFQEALWTRDQVNPADPEVDNFHVSLDGAYALSASAKLSVPLSGWKLPGVPREFNETWECCRVPMADYWGQANLVVTTGTTGANLDPDGYTIIVERADSTPYAYDSGIQVLGSPWAPVPQNRVIGINGTADFGGTFTALPCVALYSDALVYGSPLFGLAFAGARSLGVNIPTYAVTGPCPWLIARYKVSLMGVSPECSVIGGPMRSDVWLQQVDVANGRSNTKTVHFDVDCDTPATTSETGGIRATINARSGVNKLGQPSGWKERPIVLIDGAYAGVFPENDTTLVIEGLAPGLHGIGLERTEPVCGFPDGQTVTVMADAIVDYHFGWVCAQRVPDPGDVTFEATLEGPGTDPNGYRIVIDGVAATALAVDGEAIVPSVPAATPTIFHVADVSGSCQPLGPNPQVVTLDASASPLTVPFAVRCIDTKPDTLVGTIDANGWPIPTVTMRALDGRTLRVSGPRASELARLSGSSVRVWGGTSAAGIDVHGYDLRSELGDDRWLGIVLDRPDGTWLIGEEAVALVNAPASLEAASGSLVWIQGREAGGGVQPVLFGILREPAP